MTPTEERLEKLVNTKAFQALNDEERSFVFQELGSEAQYNAMREISQALITLKADLSPDPLTLGALKARMQERRHEASAFGILAWRMPAYATALIVVLISSASWWIGASVRHNPGKLVETIRYDTVFVPADPDTIIHERVVYRTIIKHQIAPSQFVKASEPISSETVGINMEEKQDLELLLVSGSR